MVKLAMTHGAARARQGSLFGGQPLGELVGFRVTLFGEAMEIADDFLLVELACKLTVPFGQRAEELYRFLHDAEMPFGSGKLHLSDADSDSVKH